jgi:hypothetical protein
VGSSKLGTQVGRFPNGSGWIALGLPGSGSQIDGASSDLEAQLLVEYNTN